MYCLPERGPGDEVEHLRLRHLAVRGQPRRPFLQRFGELFGRRFAEHRLRPRRPLADLVEDEGLGEAARGLHRHRAGGDGLAGSSAWRRRLLRRSRLRRPRPLPFPRSSRRRWIPPCRRRLRSASPGRRSRRRRSGLDALQCRAPSAARPAARGGHDRDPRRPGDALLAAPAARQDQHGGQDRGHADRGQRRGAGAAAARAPPRRSLQRPQQPPLDRPGGPLERPARGVDGSEARRLARPLGSPLICRRLNIVMKPTHSLRRNFCPKPKESAWVAYPSSKTSSPSAASTRTVSPSANSPSSSFSASLSTSCFCTTRFSGRAP